MMYLNLQRSKIAYFNAKLLKWLPVDNKSIFLDLGCGQGDFLSYLRKLGYTDITGIDKSKEQVCFCKTKLKDINIYEAEMTEFLFGKNNQYDCISALDVIEHLKKEQIIYFLNLVAKALKPGGRLIIQTPNALSPWSTGLIYGDFSHEFCFTPSSLRHILKLIGFTKIQFQATGPIVRGYKSSLRYILWNIVVVLFKLFNLVEMGTIGDGIYTRVFLCSAKK